MVKASKEKKSIVNQSRFILCFIALLCLFSGIILSTVAYVLRNPQIKAAEFDKNKQMLIAAHVLDYDDIFLVNEDNKFLPAYFNSEKQILVPFSAEQKVISSKTEMISLFASTFIKPFLTDKKGHIFSLKEKNLTTHDFTKDNKSRIPELYLFYVLLNGTKPPEELTPLQIKNNPESIAAIIIPVSGFGLWSPLYGFLALKNDGNTVLGTTWYLQGETPGLGANITNPLWLRQFYNKKIFLPNPKGTTDFETAQLGINIVKGSVAISLGDSPKASVSVDGISGATLTCNGVTEAYIKSLQNYRQLLIQFHTLKDKTKS